jgi:hypothetical protein
MTPRKALAIKAFSGLSYIKLSIFLASSHKVGNFSLWAVIKHFLTTTKAGDGHFACAKCPTGHPDGTTENLLIFLVALGFASATTPAPSPPLLLKNARDSLL